MKNIEELSVNTIRVLSAEAIQKAKSGHPGLPLGAAPMAYELWTNHIDVYKRQMLQAAKTDLAIRTGKATVHLEEAAAQDVRRQQAEEEARRKAEAEVQIQRRMEEAQKARAEAEARRLAEAQRAAEEAKREAAKKAEAQDEYKRQAYAVP